MIQSVGIIGGAGKLGQTFSGAFKSAGLKVNTSDISSPKHEVQNVLDSDWVIVIVPIESTEKVLVELKDKLSSGQILSDFTSVKTPFEEIYRKMKCAVVPCHPLFGPMPDISGQAIALIKIDEVEVPDWMIDIFTKMELRVTVINGCERHDRKMSVIQGLIHFLHITFVSVLRKENIHLENILPLCSPVYQSNFAFACRIASRDPNLYGGILMDNPYSPKLLQGFLDCAHELAEEVKGKKMDDFKALFLENKNYLGSFMEEFDRDSDFLIDALAHRRASKNSSKPNSGIE